MILIDSLLASGLRFVLGTLAKVADEENSDDVDKLRDELLQAQMKLELGEIEEDEFLAVESDVSQRLRALRERERERAEPGSETTRIAGVEVTIHEDV